MLKVGMYVRYKQIFNDRPISIGKIIKFDENIECYLLDNHKLISDKDVIIASENIIDVIKVGDYVNGEKVDEVVNGDDLKCVINYYPYHEEYYEEEDIKSIVTKEMYSNAEYKVEAN